VIGSLSAYWKYTWPEAWSVLASKGSADLFLKVRGS
jgi:hypothetical protein